MQVWSLGQEDPLEEKMATHFSILVGKIPGTEKPGGPQSGITESDMIEPLGKHLKCYTQSQKQRAVLFHNKKQLPLPGGCIFQEEMEIILDIQGLPRWRQQQRTPLPMQEIQENRVQYLGWEDPLEEEMATHSSILAWRIPWTEEPGELQSIRSLRVRHE